MAKFVQNIRWQIRRFFLHRLPTCQELAPVMSQSLDRPLTFSERLKMRMHIFICAWCERYLKQITQMQEAMRLKAEKEINNDTSTLSNEARERIKEKLKQNLKE